MAWVTLTDKAVKARLNAAEMETYEAGIGRVQDMDVMEEMLSQVTAMVRAKVASCRNNLSSMGPAGTIPEECVHAAVSIIKHDLIASFTAPGEADPRKAEFESANAFLDSVATCAVAIASPSGEYTGQSSVRYGSAKLLDFSQ